MFYDIKLSRVSLSIIILTPILWLIFGYFYINNRVTELTNQIYINVSQKMHDELETLISEKAETVLIIAMAISKNPQIKNILLEGGGDMSLDLFAKELQDNTSLKNMWFQVLSSDGTSLYRSWTDKRGVNLKKARIDIAQMIQTPEIMSSISVGKFDLSFKSMVPLFKNNQFIGFVEVIAKFNSIAKKIEKKNYDAVILVDKKYKKQLNKPFTKKFVDDYYVANLNAKDDLLQRIKEKTPAYFTNLQTHQVSTDKKKLISVYHLKDIYDHNMSYFVLFHDLDYINMSEVLQTKDRLVLFTLSIFFLILLLYYYLYAKKYKKFIQNMNTKLESEVSIKTKELHHIANHDILTGLPNRLLFLDRLEQSIKHAKRNHSEISVLFLDLDRFKEVNDTYGHDVGDKLLKVISQKITSTLREEDTVSRLGGDEFTIILNDLEEEDIISTTQKIIHLMQEKIYIDSIEIFTTFSIGICTFPQDGETSEVLLRNADTAMYKAKELGKNQYQFYNPEMTQIAIRRAKIEHDLHLAIENHELVPYFQPKIDALNNKVIGMETLMRWNHPELGILTPDKFLYVAEETGLIVPMGKQLMQTSLEIIKAWKDEGLDIGVMSFNLSIKQIEDKTCTDTIKQLLSSLKLDPKILEFEVTESQIMQNPESAISILKHIRTLGISISVDDFGTGYSSLAYLKRLPINILKIDRTFVDELPHDKDDIAIVKAIIALAESLHLEVIAEGVETKEQLEFLTAHKCFKIQGYYYSKPLPAKEYKEFLLQYQ